jgi:hypothetical protein
VDKPRYAKVYHLDHGAALAVVEEQVRGLEVAMDDLPCVSLCKHLARLKDVPRSFSGLQRPSILEPTGEVLPPQELHYHVRCAIGGKIDMEHACTVRVLELHGESRLLHETLSCSLTSLVMHELERDFLVQDFVPRPEHVAHTTTAQQLDYVIAPSDHVAWLVFTFVHPLLVPRCVHRTGAAFGIESEQKREAVAIPALDRSN